MRAGLGPLPNRCLCPWGRFGGGPVGWGLQSAARLPPHLAAPSPVGSATPGTASGVGPVAGARARGKVAAPPGPPGPAPAWLPAEPSRHAADARRTIRRGHTRFKQPGSPAGKAGNAGPAPGSSPRARRAAWTERRALPAQSVLGLQGRRPEVVRAARGRCGPRLRPRPGCGGRCPWPPAGGGRPCLDSTHPFPSRLIRGSTKIILGHLNKTYAGLNLFRSLISLAFPGVCKFGGKTATMFFFVTYA
nr:translation initiation factor IF-2-like [Manis javanica]